MLIALLLTGCADECRGLDRLAQAECKSFIACDGMAASDLDGCVEALTDFLERECHDHECPARVDRWALRECIQAVREDQETCADTEMCHPDDGTLMVPTAPCYADY